MRPEIIPAIIAKDSRDLKKKIKLVQSFVNWVQLDIMDGKFVPNETWNNPKKLKNILRCISSGLGIEAHLMVQNPYKVVSDWLSAGCKRVFVHWEALGFDKKKELKKIIEKSKKTGGEIGLAFNPKTPWQEAGESIKKEKINKILLMSVSPGFSGQNFMTEVLPKISSLRNFSKNIKIEIDGGINEKTGKLAVGAGADILAVGSAIFKSGSVEGAIKRFEKIC